MSERQAKWDRVHCPGCLSSLKESGRGMIGVEYTEYKCENCGTLWSEHKGDLETLHERTTSTAKSSSFTIEA